MLDTNIVSELLRGQPERRVMEWFATQPRASLFTTTITRCEIFYGVQVLSDGKRRRALTAVAHAVFDEDMAGHVLPFDEDAADLYAEIGASRKLAGRPISQFDCMIAAVSRSHGAMLATRNVADFTHCGIELVNPWGE